MERKTTFSYIKTIAETKSISVAADALGISQPALSSYLKKQESAVGAVLFDRSRQPLELTEAGKVYLEYLDKAISLQRDLKHNLEDIEGLRTGDIAVGGASFFNVSFLPEAIAEFISEYPGINIEIIDGKIPEIVVAAQKGLLDLFITPTKDDEDRFIYEELVSEDIYLAVPAGWEINRGLSGKTKDTGKLIGKEEFRKLCQYPFIVLKEDQDIGRRMEELFAKYECRPEHIIRVEQTMTSLALTLADVGVSLITESSIRHSMLQKLPKLYKADEGICSRVMYIAYPKNRYMSGVTAKFAEVLKKVNR